VAASRVTRVAPVLGAALLLAVVLRSHGAGAQQQDPSLNIQFHGFTDSRSVTVLSPAVDLDKDFTDRTDLRLRFGLDAVSAASDSCIRCHPQGANNQRKYINGAVIRKYGDTALSLGGEFSQENFYQATTGLTSVSRTFNKANTTVAGGYSFSWNRPNLHPSEFNESQIAQNTFASLTQTLSRWTTAQIDYEFSGVTGYQSNPFLRANVDGLLIVGVVPELRLRQSLTMRLRQALPGNTYLDADYRRYKDDWDLTANTYSLGLSHNFPQWLISGSFRHHQQTGTYFYAPSYTGEPTYFTADFRLFPFTSNLYTARAVYVPAGQLFGMLPNGAGLTFQYEFYDATTGFQAATFSTGFKIPLKRR